MRDSKTTLYIKIFINFLFVIAVALFLVFVFPKLLSFFMPLVIGWVVSLIANPLVHFLEKKVKLLRKHSTFIIIVVVIVAIVAIMALISVLIFKEAKELANDLPNLIKSTGESSLIFLIISIIKPRGFPKVCVRQLLISWLE
jgi:predicted PurR-regulated permease PerM